MLGFGLPPDVPSWGTMLSREGRQYMEMAPRLAMWPGVARTLAVYCLNMVGDALRDLLDPRLRGGKRLGGRRGRRPCRRARPEGPAEAGTIALSRPRLSPAGQGGDRSGGQGGAPRLYQCHDRLFQELGGLTDKSSKSLRRMFGPNGNPQARNLFEIIGCLQEREGLHLKVQAVR